MTLTTASYSLSSCRSLFFSTAVLLLPLSHCHALLSTSSCPTPHTTQAHSTHALQAGCVHQAAAAGASCCRPTSRAAAVLLSAVVLLLRTADVLLSAPCRPCQASQWWVQAVRSTQSLTGPATAGCVGPELQAGTCTCSVLPTLCHPASLARAGDSCSEFAASAMP